MNSLLYAMGDGADDILAVLPLRESENTKYDTVVQAFQQHRVDRHNVIFEREFNPRCQDEGESAEAFITAEHKLQGIATLAH